MAPPCTPDDEAWREVDLRFPARTANDMRKAEHMLNVLVGLKDREAWKRNDPMRPGFPLALVIDDAATSLEVQIRKGFHRVRNGAMKRLEHEKQDFVRFACVVPDVERRRRVLHD